MKGPGVTQGEGQIRIYFGVRLLEGANSPIFPELGRAAQVCTTETNLLFWGLQKPCGCTCRTYLREQSCRLGRQRGDVLSPSPGQAALSSSWLPAGTKLQEQPATRKPCSAPASSYTSTCGLAAKKLRPQPRQADSCPESSFTVSVEEGKPACRIPLSSDLRAI